MRKVSFDSKFFGPMKNRIFLMQVKYAFGILKPVSNYRTFRRSLHDTLMNARGRFSQSPKFNRARRFRILHGENTAEIESPNPMQKQLHNILVSQKMFGDEQSHKLDRLFGYFGFRFGKGGVRS